jgi:tRNA(fMet)-specific endonuclease VapC
MLDTNICIYLIKRRPQTVLDRFGAFRVGEIGVSVITAAELEYGANKSSQPKRNREALHQFLSPLEVARLIGRPPRSMEGSESSLR